MTDSKLTILVTGGSGFIGSYLVKRLLNLGNKVIVVDNFKRGLSERLPDDKRLKVVNCDITNFDELKNNVCDQDISTIFHLAAINGTENFYRIPLEIMQVGVIGAINICKLAKELNVRKIIAASSAEVYQTAHIIPTPEDVPLVVPEVANPRYSYGLSKIFTEYYTYHFCLQNKICGAIFRPHNVYGPDMGLKHVIPQFIIDMLHSRSGSIDGAATLNPRGSMNSTRAFCYVDDIVSALLLLDHEFSGVSVFNIGTQEEVTIKTLANRIAMTMGCKLNLNKSDDLHIGNTMRRVPSIEKISELGWAPKISLDEGLKKTVHWYSSNVEKLKSLENESL